MPHAMAVIGVHCPGCEEVVMYECEVHASRTKNDLSLVEKFDRALGNYQCPRIIATLERFAPAKSKLDRFWQKGLISQKRALLELGQDPL